MYIFLFSLKRAKPFESFLIKSFTLQIAVKNKIFYYRNLYSVFLSGFFFNQKFV